jgi:hypothetical protein
MEIARQNSVNIKSLELHPQDLKLVTDRINKNGLFKEHRYNREVTIERNH